MEAVFDSSQDANSQQRSFRSSLLIWCAILLTFTGLRPPRHPSELMKSGGFDWQVKLQAIIWVCLGVVGLLLIVRRRADLRLIRSGPLFWYLGFVVLALISAAWSASPLVTAYRAVQHGVAVVLVISLREQLRNLNLYLGIYIALNWVFVALWATGLHGGNDWIAGSADQGTAFMAQAGDLQWRFRSTAGHPSHISIVAGVAAISLAMRTSGRHWLARSMGCGWMMVTVVLTVSRTAIAGMFGGLFLVAFSRHKLAIVLCVAGIVIPAAMLSRPVRDKAGKYLRRGQTTRQFGSMTGRVPIYERVLEKARDNAMTGIGFQSMRVDPIAEGWLHTHNLFLESLTSLGVVGVLMSLMVLLSSGAGIITLLMQQHGRDGPNRLAAWENAAMAVPLLAFCILDVGFFAALNATVMTYIAVMAKIQTDVLESAQERNVTAIQVDPQGHRPLWSTTALSTSE